MMEVFSFFHEEAKTLLFSNSSDDEIGEGLGNNCSMMCPSLQDTPSSWPMWMYVMMNVLLLLFTLYNLSKVRKLASIRFILLCVQLAAISLRVVCNSFAFQWNVYALIIIEYTLPQFFQFVTFLCLAYFILDMFIYSQDKIPLVRREKYRLILRIVTIVVIVIMLALDIGLVFRNYCRNSPHCTFQSDDKFFDKGTALFVTILYMILSVVLGASCFGAHIVCKKCVGDFPHMVKQVRIMFYLSIFYTLIFFGRAVWALTYILKVNYAEETKAGTYLVVLILLFSLKSQVAKLSQKGNPIPYHVAWLFFYGSFELVPIFLLLIAIWKINKVMKAVDDEVDGNDDDDEKTTLIGARRKNYRRTNINHSTWS
eukprot:m.38636 g.38636  ORF g.38636 m.38636 type:complete len:369 (-) comp6812_c3_seq2:56-1162(-)